MASGGLPSGGVALDCSEREREREREKKKGKRSANRAATHNEGHMGRPRGPAERKLQRCSGEARAGRHLAKSLTEPMTHLNREVASQSRDGCAVRSTPDDG